MDRSAVKAIVDREIGPLKERLGIGHWDIKVRYGPIGGDGSYDGQCETLVDYDKSSIELDPELLADEAHALKTLRHELFHVVLSPFELFAQAVEHAGLGKPLEDVLGRVWRHSSEKAVARLEAMFQGLTRPEPSAPTP